MARFLWFWFALLTSVASQGPCATDNTIHGYTSIIAINNAMKLVLSSIESGGQPKPTYLYTLCPRTIINTNEALTPVLSGAEFICGTSGALADFCVIQGGANQVLIENSKVTGYSLHNMTFKGITFSGAAQSSIVAGAGSGTTAYFIDCKWVDFAMNSAMTLFLATGKAMTVVITGGAVQNGTAANVFKNNNGTLEIDGLTVTDSLGQTAIDTSFGGSTTIKNANFTANNYVTLVSTGKGSSVGAVNVDVTNSGSNLQQLFFADGAGATMNLTGINVHDNALASTFWDAFTFSHGAKGGIYQSRIERNSGLEFGVNVHDDSIATMEGTTFESNLASTGGFSAVLYALNNSRLHVVDANVTDNSGFTVYGFTGFQSFTQYDNTTFQGGNVVIAVFIDQDSTFGIRDIFFINVQSQGCPPPNQREYVENIGSHCFYRGPGECKGKCGVLKNNTLAPTTPVSHPTSAPSVLSQTSSAPSQAPVARPVVSLAPTSPLETLSPTFIHSGVITFAPVMITSAPTAEVNKVGKKGKKSNKKATKKAAGKKSEKGEPGTNGEATLKRKKSAKTVETESPVPVVSLASPAPSMIGMVPSSPPSSSPTFPKSSPVTSSSTSAKPSLHAKPSLSIPASQTVSSAVPTGEHPSTALPISPSHAPVPPTTEPVPVEPPHFLKKKKSDEKGTEKLVKNDKVTTKQKTVDTKYRTNVFVRDTPKTSRRRGARGL